MESIRATGLVSGSRQHVHMCSDEATAIRVGQRHGQPAILVIHAGAMAAAGHRFYLSANGVWLTDAVAAVYIDFDAVH